MKSQHKTAEEFTFSRWGQFRSLPLSTQPPHTLQSQSWRIQDMLEETQNQKNLQISSIFLQDGSHFYLVSLL